MSEIILTGIILGIGIFLILISKEILWEKELHQAGKINGQARQARLRQQMEEEQSWHGTP
jgi:hypothetical protein